MHVVFVMYTFFIVTEIQIQLHWWHFSLVSEVDWSPNNLVRQHIPNRVTGMLEPIFCVACLRNQFLQAGFWCSLFCKINLRVPLWLFSTTWSPFDSHWLYSLLMLGHWNLMLAPPQSRLQTIWGNHKRWCYWSELETLHSPTAGHQIRCPVAETCRLNV